LRASKVLPRQPLDVFLVGAEISEPARTYAQEMLDELRETLQAQAIFVESEFLCWDVTDALSNTDLIKRMTQVAMTHHNRLLVVANFNAFLEKERKRKKAEPQLSELFRHASGAHSIAIWIEPMMNRATAMGGLLSWLKTKLTTDWRPFAQVRAGSSERVVTTSAEFYPPLSPASPASVRLAIMPINLERDK